MNECHMRRKSVDMAINLGGACVLVILSMTGCASHLHNPEDQALAETAQSRFRTLTEAQEIVFDSMRANLETMSAFEAEAYDDIAERLNQIEARNVARWSWEELRSKLRETGFVQDLKSRVQSMAERVRRELVAARLQRQEDLDDLAKAKQELEEAKARLTDWSRRVAVAEKLIVLTPALTGLKEVSDVDTFKETAVSISEQFKTAKVAYLDAEGRKREATLADELPKLLDTDEVMLSGDAESGKVISGLRAVLDPEAPGLVLTIAALSKDLAERELARARAHLSTLEKRVEMISRAENLVKMAERFSEEGYQAIADPSRFPDDEKVLDGFKRLAGVPAQDADPLAGAYLAAQHYLTIAGPITASVEESIREDAYLRHMHSIEISQINASLHEALAARGIEGLLAYHRGGVRPGEVAELVYKVTQLTLLGVLTGQVN